MTSKNRTVQDHMPAGKTNTQFVCFFFSFFRSIFGEFAIATHFIYRHLVYLLLSLFHWWVLYGLIHADIFGQYSVQIIFFFGQLFKTPFFAQADKYERLLSFRKNGLLYQNVCDVVVCVFLLFLFLEGMH